MNPLEARRRLLGRNVYKRTTEGNPAIAQGSLARMYPGITMQGWTEQVNAGQTLLPYEPYTGGKPSPSPDYPQEIVSAGKYNEDTQKYEVEVKLTGKNLIDKEDLYSYEKLIKDFQGQGFWIYPIDIPDGTYTFSAENSPYTSGGYLAIGTYTQDSVRAKSYIAHPSVATKKATVELSGNKCIFLSAGNQVNDNVKNAIGWIQLEHGSIATEYEPYKEPKTVTLTADRPLTKWDRLEKRNGQWGWVYKSEEIETYTDESVPGEYFSTTGQLSIGAQVWYETATETFVPLSSEEQEQMNALHTNRPTTVLSNDCECSMSLTYKTKKSMGGG